MGERLSFAQKKTPKFDIDKCPLLSKPGELYKRKMKMNASPNYPIFNVNRSKPSTTTINEEQLKCDPEATFAPQPSETETKTMANSNASKTSELNSSNISSEKPQSCLRNIYPASRFKLNYAPLFINEHVADIFIYFTLNSGTKHMTHADFRTFVK